MLIDGVWRANYVLNHPEPFTDMGDPEEFGIIVIQDGLIMGRDPWGSQYSGKYTLKDSKIHAILDVSAYTPYAQPVFDDLVHPFQLEINGEFNSPDFFSVIGSVVGTEARNLVVNCRRYF